MLSNNETGFLTDDNGRKSAVRLYALLTLLTGFVLAFLAVFLDSERALILAVTFVGAAFTGKVAQKSIEASQ